MTEIKCRLLIIKFLSPAFMPLKLKVIWLRFIIEYNIHTYTYVFAHYSTNSLILYVVVVDNRVYVGLHTTNVEGDNKRDVEGVQARGE